MKRHGPWTLAASGLLACALGCRAQGGTALADTAAARASAADDAVGRSASPA